MTKEELAAILDGSEYPLFVCEELSASAKAARLVIVYGASDDLMEFRGTIDDELGVYGGATVSVDAKGLKSAFEELKVNDASEEEFIDYFMRKGFGKEIKAIWDRDGYSWVYETDIPHATFDIMEDGEKYCKGIVFSLDDLK